MYVAMLESHLVYMIVICGWVLVLVVPIPAPHPDLNSDDKRMAMFVAPQYYSLYILWSLLPGYNRELVGAQE